VLSIASSSKLAQRTNCYNNHVAGSRLCTGGTLTETLGEPSGTTYAEHVPALCGGTAVALAYHHLVNFKQLK
jgi:hypothetical protein